MLKCNLVKNVEAVTIQVDFELAANELLVILGPSGCGKSTLLNLIAGFRSPDEGRMILDNTLFYRRDKRNKKSIEHPINKRDIGYIQQESCLFPHMSVKENMLYGVKRNHRDKVESHFSELIKALDIESILEEYPAYLSGGQQQRVAIGRALMRQPKLLLWDEPFSALDNQIREELRILVHELKSKYAIPMIFVTHDLREAYELADRLAVMKDGRFLQIGSREKIFNQPLTTEIANLVGLKNRMSIDKKNGQEVIIDGITLRIDERDTHNQGGWIGIRPENILYVREEDGSVEPESVSHITDNVFTASVLNIRHQLDHYYLTIKIPSLEKKLEMAMPRAVIQRYHLEEGQHIRVLLKYKSLVIMEEK